MKKNITKATAALLFALTIMMVVVSLPVDQACAARRIIRESSVSNDYQPGPGMPIGKVRRVSGKVFIMHEDMGAVYTAENNFALYAGDTITTKHNGKISFIMKDDSVMTLAPNTTMVLNESVFDPAAKRRTSLINLISGKARFFVKKFADFQNSNFRVRTKTSIAAVRGSEFIIEQVGDKTIITTMGLTVLEVTNTAYPLADPILISSFQQLIVTLGELTGNPFDISEDTLRQILIDLGVTLDDDDAFGGDDTLRPGGSANDNPNSPSSP